MNNKRIIQVCVGLALPLAMAACSQGGYSGFPYELNTLKASTPAGSPFTQDLSKGYLDLAESNKDKYNWPLMSLWAHKGLEADHGVVVMPEEVAAWSYDPLQIGGVNGTFFHPDPEAAVPLNEARVRLMAMLASDAPNRVPHWAAKAQTKFDCWVEATHEAWDTIEDCRKGFDEAMLQTNAPAKHAEAAPAPAPVTAASPMIMAPAAYLVFFDFDKSDIKSEARGIIASAAEAIKSGHQVKINVVGFTDTMGTMPYNDKLSFRRGNAVERELVSDGVTVGDIVVDGKGKSDLLVQTADEVREPKNRRATIELTVQ